MIDYIEWHITNRCNLECKHCMVDAGVVSYEMDNPDIAKCIDFIKKSKAKYINITGGEPLLIPNILNIGNDLKLNGGILTLSTNGTLDIDIKNLKKIMKAFSGGIQISIDSLCSVHDNIRGVKGSLNKSLNFISRLRSISSEYNIQICMCLLENNYNKILDFEELIDNYKIDSFKILKLLHVGRGEYLKNVSNKQKEESILQIHKLSNICSNTRIYYNDPLTNFKESMINGKLKDIKFLNITHDLNVKIMPYINLVLGNIKKGYTIKDFLEHKNKILELLYNEYENIL